MGSYWAMVIMVIDNGRWFSNSRLRVPAQEKPSASVALPGALPIRPARPSAASALKVPAVGSGVTFFKAKMVNDGLIMVNNGLINNC